MRRPLIVWGFIVCVVISVIVILNYRGKKEAVPLSELFPDEETYPIDVEYEFSKAGPKDDSPLKNETGKVEEKPEPFVVQTPEVTLKKEGQYSIQVASFRTLSKAEEVLSKLKSKNLSARIVKKNLGEKGTWHRVMVGAYNDKSNAQEVLIKVKKDFKDSFIITSSKK